MDGAKAGTGDTAPLIDDANGQTVRLPEGYRLDAKEVRIRREGNALVLEPVKPETDDWAWLEELWAMGPPDEDFVNAVLNERPGPETYERPDIDLDP